MSSVLVAIVLGISFEAAAETPPLTPIPGPLPSPASGVGGGGGGGSGTFLRLDGTNAMLGTASVNATDAGGINFGGAANASITYDATTGLVIQSPTNFFVAAGPNGELWTWTGFDGLASLLVVADSNPGVGTRQDLLITLWDDASGAYAPGFLMSGAQTAAGQDASALSMQATGAGLVGTTYIGSLENRLDTSSTPQLCVAESMETIAGTNRLDCFWADGGATFGGTGAVRAGSAFVDIQADNAGTASGRDLYIERTSAAAGIVGMEIQNLTTSGAELIQLGQSAFYNLGSTYSPVGLFLANRVVWQSPSAGMVLDLQGQSGATGILAYAGSASQARLNWSNTSVIINDTSNNVDTTVETDNNANAFNINSDSTAANEGIGLYVAATAGNIDHGLHIATSSTAMGSVTTGTCTSETVSGDDTLGEVTATCAAGETIILTFGDGYNAAPKCVISARDTDAAASGAFVSATATGTFTITAVTGDADPQVWTYWCAE